tara:strand:+ start:784 stop:1317 length:534 start_codon:yes stop_codon:yes gene_type:complete
MLLFNSCGLRQDSESYENVLLDTWNLAEIKCYNPNYTSGNRLERYVISNLITVEMKFTPRSFTYAVTETGNTENCITAANGGYGIGYINAKEGSVRYKNMNLNIGCDIEVSESSGGTPVTIPFGLSALEDDADALYWTINTESQLVLQVSTGFQGSDVGTLCGEECICYGIFSSKTN